MTEPESHNSASNDPVASAPALGARLRLAREAAGLTLSDAAQRTHVRRAYLEALEESRYVDLPELVYARNFVRLYATTVGLPADEMLDLFTRERRAALGTTTLDQRLERDRRHATTVKPGGTTPTTGSVGWSWSTLTPLLITALLLLAIGGLAWWGLQRLNQTVLPPATAPAAVATTPTLTAPTPSERVGGQADAGDEQVLVAFVSEPAGAVISIDGFALPGRTPLVDVPLSARAGRVVRAELDGYSVSETVVDVLDATTITLVLEREAVADTNPQSVGLIEINITTTSWLEVYRGSQRNEGERLVFQTAAPGARFTFNPPIFVYVGNAAGVRVSVDGQDQGAMGGPGVVLGRAFGE